MRYRVCMRFEVGAQVVVTAIHKTGRVVEATRGGRYRVRVGGVVMACREEELLEAAPDRKSKKAAKRESRAGESRSATGESHPKGWNLRGEQRETRSIEVIDLHGLTVEEAVRAVEERLDAALLAGVERLEIIHGRSSGRIKIAVHKLLRELTVVRRFEVAPENPGVTRVFL